MKMTENSINKKIRKTSSVIQKSDIPSDMRYYKKQEVAEFLSVSHHTIDTWLERGKFPRPDIDIRNFKRWKWATIEAFINNIEQWRKTKNEEKK